MLSIAVLLAAFTAVLATPPADTNCGVPTIKPNTAKIVGGAEAKAYSWPWQVQIRYNNDHFCGASIVSNDYILTAAHCLKGFSSSAFSFHVGRFSRVGVREPYEQVSYPRTISMHESYNQFTMVNDIAVIRITPALNFNSQVSPICLPKLSGLTSGTSTYVTGWGAVRQGGAGPTNLQQVMVPVIDTRTCNGASYYNGQVKTGMFCAGYAAGGKDSCQGDSGGPLVSLVNGRWEQYGVVSWGEGCAQSYRPGIYTDVPYFNTWIRARVVQLEREEQVVSQKFKPVPAGSAFREMAKQLVKNGEVNEDDLPNPSAWM